MSVDQSVTSNVSSSFFGLNRIQDRPTVSLKIDHLSRKKYRMGFNDISIRMDRMSLRYLKTVFRHCEQ